MDRLGTICGNCGEGTYEETSIHDDMDGAVYNSAHRYYQNS